MSKRQIITIGVDGSLSSEMDGFDDKGCFAAAAEIEKLIAGFGVEVSIDGIVHKDTAPVQAVARKQTVKVSEK